MSDLRDGDGNNWVASLQSGSLGQSAPPAFFLTLYFWEPAAAASFETSSGVRVYQDFFEYDEPDELCVHRTHL